MYVCVLTISSQQLKQRVDAVLVGDPLNEELMNHQGPTMVGTCIDMTRFNLHINTFICTFAIHSIVWTSFQVVIYTDTSYVSLRDMRPLPFYTYERSHRTLIHDLFLFLCLLDSKGPIVSKGQFDRVSSFIAAAKEENLTFLCGGEPSADFKARLVGGPAVPEKGFFVPPTVLVDVPETSRLWKEEIFGPVLCIRVGKGSDNVAF